LITDVRSPQFKAAVARIQKRAEKIGESGRLADLFVHSDVRVRVETTDSQLILGRRGTGKTHLIRAFEEDAERHGQFVIAVDCTRLGSGYGGLDVAARAIAAKYYTALLNQIGTELHDYSMRMEAPDPQSQLNVMTRLVEAFVPLMDPNGADANSSLFNYAQIARTVEQVLRALRIDRVFLILDEWAQIQVAAQPYLAEFIKRSLAVVSNVSLKIVAVNYQCQFSTNALGNIIGLQQGADIPDVIDLDRYLIPAEREQAAVDFFSQVLYNHLGIELAWDLTVGPQAKRIKVENLFTQSQTFLELVRAAEGNCRDFLCIYSAAYFDEFSVGTGVSFVSKPNVVKAATTWFDSQKLANIKAEPEVLDTLAFIMDRILKG
jgi:hypothetical protein